MERWRSGIRVEMGGRLIGWYSVLYVFFVIVFELDLIAVYMTCNNITYNVVIHVMDSKL